MDAVYGFLLEDLDIHGALVQLGPSWAAIAIEDEICGHEYRCGPEIVDELFPPDGRLLH